MIAHLLMLKYATYTGNLRRQLGLTLLLCLLSLPLFAAEEPAGEDSTQDATVTEVTKDVIGENTEQHLPPDEVFIPWVQDDSQYKQEEEDQVEIEKSLEKVYTTKKLKNVVPPIRFQSGVAEIPERFVVLLREVLEKMKDRTNVRLHFIGHTDNVPLSGSVAEQYGDN
ncbi:MAG: hypothetical protein PVG50_06090, partial [Thiohalophilus sp.]